MRSCECQGFEKAKLVVLTGGPGAGKTAVLELVKQEFCEHVRVLPEAAGIVFGGGFPRRDDVGARAAAQRAIFHIQVELERAESHGAAVLLCDRGTLDGLAYWPHAPDELWRDVHSTLDEQLRRYDAVIHLRTPSETQGYNQRNVLRIETAAQAQNLDARIAAAWEGHPRRFFVESSGVFMRKASQAVEIVRNELPACCRGHLDGILARQEHGHART